MVSRQEVSYCYLDHQQSKGGSNKGVVFIISPMQALHTKKLEQALRSNERFPINLEWMVDVFKYPSCLHMCCMQRQYYFSDYLTVCRYKHISSLTTHLKRHFKMSIHLFIMPTWLNSTRFLTISSFIQTQMYITKGLHRSKTRGCGRTSSQWTAS
jgi:hypothetical protein